MDASVRGKLRDHICVDNSDLSWQCHNQINYVNSCIESAKIHHPSNNCQNDDVWSLSGNNIQSLPHKHADKCSGPKQKLTNNKKLVLRSTGLSLIHETASHPPVRDQ